MGAALALLAAAAGLGAWVLRALRAEPPRAPDALLAALAVGNALLGVVGLGLAAGGALRPAVVWALVACLAAPGLPRVASWLPTLWAHGRRPRAWGATGIFVAYVVVLLVMVLAPAVTGDQTKYQLAYPKLYAAAGGLVQTPWTFWGQQQFLENFVYALAFTVGDETTARLLHAALGLVAVGAATRLVGRWLAPGWQWAMAALVVTQPMTWTMFRATGSDLPVVAYTVLAVGALLAWRGGEGDGALRRAGLLAGAAGGCKVMGLLTGTLVGGLAVAYALRGGLARAARVGLVFGCLTAAVAAGPYVRNALETGNPLHPFGYRIFGGAHWSGEAATYLHEYYGQYRAERAARRGDRGYVGLDVLRFPWDLTMYPESFERSVRWALDVGPFMLATMPAAVWLAAVPPAARDVVIVGLLYLGVVAGGAWAHPRYVLPGIVLLTTAGLGGLSHLCGRRTVFAVVGITVIGHLLVTGRMAGPLWPDQLQVAVGRLDRAGFLQRHSDRWRFWSAANGVLPAEAVVLVLGKIPHPYFIEGRFVLGSYLEQTEIDYRRIDAPEALLAAARDTGATHVVFETADLARGADPFERRVVALWAALRARLGRPLVAVEGRELYRLAGGAAG